MRRASAADTNRAFFVQMLRRVFTGAPYIKSSALRGAFEPIDWSSSRPMDRDLVAIGVDRQAARVVERLLQHGAPLVEERPPIGSGDDARVSGVVDVGYR
jgi:hypothetical protein